jgi:hypothetical protein
MNLETMNAMKDGARVLKKIHGNMSVTYIHLLCRALSF